MEKFHKDLMKNNEWYSSWHKNPNHIVTHWFVLIMVGAIMGSVLTSTISHLNLELSFSTSLGKGQSNQSVSREAVTGKTNMLLQLAKAYQQLQSNGQASTTALEQLTAVATDRAQSLNNLISLDPGSALLEAIPTTLAEQLPSEIQPLLEKQVVKTGTVTVYYEDYLEEGREVIVYALDSDESGPNNAYRMYFAQGEPNVKTGDRIKVSGVALKNSLVMAEAGGSSVQVTSTSSTAALSGDQSTLAILFNFSDNTSQPFSPANIANALFNNADSSNLYYQEVSSDAVSFSGLAVGWYTIPYSSSTCNTNTWASAANSAAQSAGINLSSYPRRVYVFPRTSSCAWAGLGTVGGNPSGAWINGYSTSYVYSHELGHNLGMHHAASYLCGSVAIASSGCTYSEYGDPFDVMGAAWIYRHVNGAHKTQVGWVNTRTVTSSGTYTVNILEDAVGYQALKIAKPDTAENYFVEYRQARGFDASLPGNMVNGVSVIVHNGSSQTKKLDLIPDGNLDASALVDGGSFTDIVNGITITQISHDATQATVQISMTGPTCNPAAPTVSLSPVSQSGTAGQTLNYSVSVRNNDNSACFSSTFNLLPGPILSGWTTSLGAASLSIGPGQTASTTFAVTSGSTSADGSYGVAVAASDSSTPVHNATANATYMVYTPVPDTTAPQVTITSPKSGAVLKQKGKQTVAASATDASGIAKLDLFIDSTLVRTCTNTTTCSYNLSLNSLTAGQHTISAQATDKSASANTNQTSINVTK